MIKRLLIFSLALIFAMFLSAHSYGLGVSGQLQKSIELVGVKAARLAGLEGQGIKVAVIDTGIDYNHPDLAGYGPAGKVIGGYDFVNSNERPIDTNGHGTEVAGIIAADGNLSGMVPKAKLLSYKVSSTGEGVSSDLIIRAINQAVQDGANVINISLGINRTNDQIDSAIDQAVKKGIVVVVAAGNNGPQKDTIGSPGLDYNAITVGASYNNLTSSLAATFVVGKNQYEVVPMEGTRIHEGPIEGRIIYGGYGRVGDLTGLDVRGSILLEERGSNIAGQKVYFAEKERNAADLGAKGLVVFNNESGIFAGELFEPNKTTSYSPRIPVVSMSMEEGQQLRHDLRPSTAGTLDIFYHPDFAAPFSSAGPVSPFYIKPDLVAPGVFVNSTTLDGKYNSTSGTSFAAPHVAGAAAILLQKHPGLSPEDVVSILVTTTDPVTDAYGKLFPISVVGSGRLNVTRALESNLAMEPHGLVFHLSYGNRSQSEMLHLKTLDGSPVPHLAARFSSDNSGLAFDYSQSGGTLTASITYNGKSEGTYDGFLLLTGPKTTYRVPVVVHVTLGTLLVNQRNGTLYFSLDYPGSWSYAKISLARAGTDELTSTSITPQETASLPAYESGQYWVTAQITDMNRTEDAYKTVYVGNPAQRSLFDLQGAGIPPREAAIVSGIVLAVVAVGAAYRLKRS